MSQSQAIIRRAAATDASAIEALYRELVSDPFICVLPEQVGALAASPTNFLLVAKADGIVCPTALLSVCPDVMYRTQPFGVVENVVVTEAVRGRGVGRLLLAQVEQLAGDHGCSKLMLLSGAVREAAHAFFRRGGFTGDTKHALVKYRRQFAAHDAIPAPSTA